MLCWEKIDRYLLMKDYNIEIGDKIRQCRKFNNITMKELGKSVNLSESTIQRYESGQIKTLDINLLKKIALVLNTTPAYLMGLKDSELFPNTNEKSKDNENEESIFIDVADMNNELIKKHKILYSKTKDATLNEMNKIIAMVDILMESGNGD